MQQSLDEAEAKEQAAAETHTKLMETKNSQKTQTEEALNKMELEGAARQLTKTEAEEESNSLGEQIKNDEGYIQQAKKDLETKTEEYGDRKEGRANEMAAISKAIAILHGDDSRDLFKKSFASQGYLFLQENSGLLLQRGSAASAALRAAGHATNDGRLFALAARVGSSKGRFDEVLDAISKMLTRLKQEEQDDLQKKETCEKERMEDTRAAIKHSRDIDEDTELMNRLAAEIAKLEAEKADFAEIKSKFERQQKALAKKSEQKWEEKMEGIYWTSWKHKRPIWMRKFLN